MRGKKRPGPARAKRRDEMDVGKLISGLPKDKAEMVLKLLPVDELLVFCKEKSIPVDGKESKAFFVRRIIFYLYELGIGHELIRRFSEREEEQKEISEFEGAVRFYEENMERLVSEYEGKYVAVLNNKVLDADEDFGALAKRVYSKYGYRHLFIHKVSRGEVRVSVPSPFFSVRR